MREVGIFITELLISGREQHHNRIALERATKESDSLVGEMIACSDVISPKYRGARGIP